jgi:hypothetical protein
MTPSGWEAGDIYEILRNDHKLIDSDLTVIKHDSKNNVVLGYTKEGLVFLSCKQYGQISGFRSGRAKLEVLQEINQGSKGTISPAFILSFLVTNDEELKAISAIFSGLYEFNRSYPETSKATDAAQGFEDYLKQFPKLGMSREIEVGLFGELSFIAASKNSGDLISGWHSTPSSTFDFSYNSSRLEVKTSTRPTRVHWLRSTQSLVKPEENLFYLSIYAPEDNSGVTLLDLLSRINQSISDTEIQQFLEKTSFYEIEKAKIKFDYNQTVRSFKFIDSESIPLPNFNKKQILEVQWKCNFNEINETNKLNPWLELMSN